MIDLDLAHGSYVMMDHDYNSVRDPAGMPVREFRSSLYVLATVISVQVGTSTIETFLEMNHLLWMRIVMGLL